MAVPAGKMRHQVRFDRRAAGNDAYGNVLQNWAEVVTLRAALRPQTGREALAAGRLESSLVGVLTVRRFSTTAALTAADRGTFTLGPYAGRIFNIRAIIPSVDSSTLELTIEEGVAT